MLLFATPDFGAGAAIALFVVCVYGILLMVCAWQFLYGWWKRRGAWKRKSARWQEEMRAGAVMMILAMVLPLGCCLAPFLLFLVACGSFPHLPDRNLLKKGMTKEEVLKIAGKPHAIAKPVFPEERWSYYGDPFGLSDLFLDFDKEGIFQQSYSH